MKRTLFFVLGIFACVFMVVLALAGRGQAQYSTPQTIVEECISNTTLHTQINETICIDGDCDIFSRGADTVCVFGCDFVQNVCKPNTFNQNLIFLGAVIVVILLLVFISRYL